MSNINNNNFNYVNQNGSGCIWNNLPYTNINVCDSFNDIKEQNTEHKENLINNVMNQMNLNNNANDNNCIQESDKHTNTNLYDGYYDITKNNMFQNKSQRNSHYLRNAAQNTLNLNYNNIPTLNKSSTVTNNHYQLSNNNGKNYRITPSLTLSYDNFELNHYYKQKTKDKYRNELLAQINEKEERKRLDKQRKMQEDIEEEARIIREQESLNKKLQPPPNITVLPKKYIKPTNNDIYYQTKINNITKLREQMNHKNLKFYNQINSLRHDMQSISIQGINTFKKIAKLKNEFKYDDTTDKIRQQFIYDIISDDKYNKIYENKRYDNNKYLTNENDFWIKDCGLYNSNGNQYITTESKLIWNENNKNDYNDKNVYDNDHIYSGKEDGEHCITKDAEERDDDEFHEVKRIYNNNELRLYNLRNGNECKLFRNLKSNNNKIIKERWNDYLNNINYTYTSM